MTKPIFMGEADVLAETYYHTCTVKRPKPSKDELGFDSFEFEEVYKDIECAISFAGGSTQDISDTTQPIEYIATLFARPNVIIKAGDWIEADVLGVPYEFRAGEGVIYQSHIEVPLIRKEDA
ncbi:MAG: hypothetical protein SOU08_00165 [Anaerococcus sp.]|nr:hypothetical protein [Anaerococcus sp.]